MKIPPLLSTLLLCASMLSACGGREPSPPPAPPSGAPVMTVTMPPDPAAPLPDPGPAPSGPVGRAPVAQPALEPIPPEEAAALYARCQARVEGAQVAGECATDADCGRAGCSSEVCVPAAKVADVMTTCEMDPCFRVLGSCGCQAGECRWTLATAAPPLLRPLPIQIQPGGQPGGAPQ